MNKEQTIENNKLIAGFMGQEPKMVDLHEFTDEEPLMNEEWSRPEWFNDELYHLYGWYDIRHAQSMRYHKDWNWLMPVVEKMWSITGRRSLFHITVAEAEYDKYGTCITPEFTLFSENYRIDSPLEQIYGLVVDFIKWYNEQK